MSAGGAPNRDTVIGALVLAFSHSELKELVGTDALRSVLAGQYRDMVSGGVLHLQLVYDLLADQPGFNAASANAPLCVIKGWERELGLEVELPKEMGDLSSTELMAHASHCVVPKNLRTRLFDPEGAKRASQAAQAQLDKPHVPAGQSPSARRPGLELALGAVALLGLAFAGYTLVDYMGGPQFDSVAVDEIDSSLPVSSAKQLGGDLHVVIADDTWFDLPGPSRQETLTAALEKLRGRDVSALIVQDSTGEMRASAQWLGASGAVEVRFH